MKDLAIETDNLTKKFGKVIAVNDLNLKVPTGIIYGYLGPNGAGKTTTIKMLVDSLFPTSGRIQLFGQEVKKNKTRVFRNIGYVPEHPVYFREYSGEKLLRYVGKIFNFSKNEIQTRISKILNLVNLVEARHRAIGKYSAGMKQRIGIAQALMNDPDLLILDEITSNLDPLGRSHIIDLLKQLKKEGKTIFVSTHILPEVQKMNADHIGILNKGRLFAEGTINHLQKLFGENMIKIRPKDDRIRKALESKDFIQDIVDDEKYLIVKTSDREATWNFLSRFSLENHMPIIDFIGSGMEIEDIFMKVLENNSAKEVAKA
ncbi:MAG: ABC transporter ATP-binding protein [Candidatus Helarchaeota archaeon]